MHWERIKRAKKKGKQPYLGEYPRKCTFPGCDQKHHARGYCLNHWNNYRKGRSLIPLEDAHRGFQKGGISYYLNHTEMKKIRLIKLKEASYKCEDCGEFGNKIHHIDQDRSNHKIDNLKTICNKCHKKLHPIKTSKFLRIYGKTASQISKDLGMSEGNVSRLQKRGQLVSLLAL